MIQCPVIFLFACLLFKLSQQKYQRAVLSGAGILHCWTHARDAEADLTRIMVHSAVVFFTAQKFHSWKLRATRSYFSGIPQKWYPPAAPGREMPLMSERCLMVLSASPVSISVPSLFQGALSNLSVVVGLQRSQFICGYKLCVALLQLIIVVPSSFAWCLINCRIVKEGRLSYQVCIRVSDHSCAWCERQEAHHQSHQKCTYELCNSCVGCHICEHRDHETTALW